MCGEALRGGAMWGGWRGRKEEEPLLMSGLQEPSARTAWCSWNDRTWPAFHWPTLRPRSQAERKSLCFSTPSLFFAVANPSHHALLNLGAAPSPVLARYLLVVNTGVLWNTPTTTTTHTHISCWDTGCSAIRFENVFLSQTDWCYMTARRQNPLTPHHHPKAIGCTFVRPVD